MRISELLKPGYENRISGAALLAITGCNSMRELRKQISVERLQGSPILSTRAAGGGYYLPGGPEETREFCATMLQEARALLAVVEALRSEGQ